MGERETVFQNERGDEYYSGSRRFYSSPEIITQPAPVNQFPSNNAYPTNPHTEWMNYSSDDRRRSTSYPDTQGKPIIPQSFPRVLRQQDDASYQLQSKMRSRNQNGGSNYDNVNNINRQHVPIPSFHKVGIMLEPFVTLYFCGVTSPRTLQGSCGWVVRDERNDILITEGSKKVDLVYAGSIRPDYEGLHFGLVEALNRGIRKIRVLGDSELVFIHLNTGAGLSCCQSIYRVVEDISKQVRYSCRKFHDISFDLIPREANGRARSLAANALVSTSIK
jgi:ribonuclease HI